MREGVKYPTPEAMRLDFQKLKNVLSLPVAIVFNLNFMTGKLFVVNIRTVKIFSNTRLYKRQY